jgi:hypothetical protein
MALTVSAAARTGLVCLSLGAVACSRCASSAPDALAPPPIDPAEAVVCASRPECRLQSKLAEKPTSDGTGEVVVLVSLGKAGPHHGSLSSANWREVLRQRGDTVCFPWELWLVRLKGASAERDQLLISDCTRDIHGQAPGVRDLGPGQIRYTPEPSQDEHSFDFALDPLTFQRERTVLEGREVMWDWQTFGGQACYRGTCVPALPDVSVKDPEFARGGWKSAALDHCALLVDGASRGTSSSAFRLLLSDEILYVEVTDDKFVTAGPVVDTLDLGRWFSEAKPDEPPRHERLRMDGQLRDWLGKVITVDVSITPTSRRFALPAASWSWIRDEKWEATYEDTDDAHTVAARLSTGPHEMPPPVFTAPGACAVEGGALRPVRTRPLDSGAALAP